MKITTTRITIEHYKERLTYKGVAESSPNRPNDGESDENSKPLLSSTASPLDDPTATPIQIDTGIKHGNQ